LVPSDAKQHTQTPLVECIDPTHLDIHSISIWTF